MNEALTRMPLWLLGLLVVGAFMAAAVGGLAVTRRWMRPYREVPNDLAGFVFAVVGVSYAVVLGLSALTAYEHFSEVERTMALEANAVGDLYRDLEGYPAATREPLQGLLGEYVRVVIGTELPALRRAEERDDAARVVDRLVVRWVAHEPRTEGQKALHAEALSQLNRFLSLRSQRLADGQAGLHPVVWGVLLAGAGFTIGFTYLFWGERHQLHGLMVACLAGTIGLVVFWMIAMDRPLWGPLVVSDDDFERVSRTIDRLEGGQLEAR
jgi:hypothetical protein